MIGHYSSYATAILCSLLLHGLVIAALVIGWVPENKTRTVVKPRYIEATLLQLEPKAVPKTVVDDSAARRRAEQQKAEQERQAARAQQEKRRQEQARKEAAERKRKQELARKEKARQEQLKKEQAEKKRLEEQRREQERRKKLEQDLNRALNSEEEFIEAASDQQQIGSYTAYIRERIENNWSRPPSARRDMEVLLEIQLVPTGRIAGVSIIKSSGNSAFDRSAEQAVYKVGQFDQLRGMDSGLFERNFRRFRMSFKAEDLRL